MKETVSVIERGGGLMHLWAFDFNVFLEEVGLFLDFYSEVILKLSLVVGD